MVKKLVSRSEFARIAGVTPTAITKLCGGTLAPVCVGKKIDCEHPLAIEYLHKQENKRPPDGPPPAPGIDPLYEKALAAALANGRTGVRLFIREFGISTDRAQKLVAQVNASGVLQRLEKDRARVEAGTLKPASTISINGGTPFPMFVPPPKAAPSPFPPPHEDDNELPSPSEYPGEQIEDLTDLTLRELINKFGTADRFKTWLQARKSLVDIGAKEIVNAEKRGKLIPRDFVESHIIGAYDRAHINLMTDGSQNIARRLHSKIQAGETVEECEVFISEQISRHVKEAKDSILRSLKNV